jgi:hypothetical protein
VDPVPVPLLLGKSEAVYFLLHVLQIANKLDFQKNIYKFSSYLAGNTVYLCYVARNFDH